MAPVEEIDSGMESPEVSQSADPATEKESQEEEILREPEPLSKKQPAIENTDYDEEVEETFAERLWGLTEMFPPSVRNVTHSAIVNTQKALHQTYNLSRSAAWVVFTSSLILFAPMLMEVERANMEEMQRNQQRQLLLGPNSALSGNAPPPLMPPVQQR